MEKFFAAVLVAAAISFGATVQEAHAVLFWDWDILNNGQFVEGTDQVNILARMYNNSSEGETVGSFSANYAFNSASANLISNYNNFSFGPSPAHDFFGQFSGLELAPGNFYDFTFGVYYPDGGDAPDGFYETTGGLILAGGESVNKRIFWFTSCEPDNCGENVIPEPMSLLLLASGLGTAFLRKRQLA